MADRDTGHNADNNNDNGSGRIRGSSARSRRGAAVRRAKDSKLPSKPRKRNKRRRPESTDNEDGGGGGGGADPNARDAPETPAAKQPRTGLYRRVSGVVGRVVGLLTPGRAVRKVTNGTVSPASAYDNDSEGDQPDAATDATDDNYHNDEDQGEEQDNWSPTRCPGQRQSQAGGKGKGRSGVGGGGGAGRHAIGSIGERMSAAAGEDTREAGRPWVGSGDHYPRGVSARSRGVGSSPVAGLGVEELLEVAGGNDTAFSPRMRHILRDERRTKSGPSRGSKAAAEGERLPSRVANAPRVSGDGRRRSTDAGKKAVAGAVRDSGYPAARGLISKRGRHTMDDGMDDSVRASSRNAFFPSEDAAGARPDEGSRKRTRVLQQRRSAAATAVLAGDRRDGMEEEEFEVAAAGGEVNKISKDEPFTLSEQRDLARAVRFGRNLPASAAMYILSKMESRQAAHIRMQLIREYGKSGVSSRAPLAGPAHASLSGSGNNMPVLVAPVAQRRLAPPGSELVPTAPPRNAPLMLPPPPRDFSSRADGAATATAAGSRDGMRSGIPYNRRSSAGERMQAPMAPRRGDPDGLLTPARRAREETQQQDSGRER